ncbi:hypothetical protein D3C71_1939210 [compost metagenome]
MQLGQTQLGLDLIGDFFAKPNGIPLNLVTFLVTERGKFRQVAEGQRIARTHPFKGAGTGQ